MHTYNTGIPRIRRFYTHIHTPASIYIHVVFNTNTRKRTLPAYGHTHTLHVYSHTHAHILARVRRSRRARPSSVHNIHYTYGIYLWVSFI